MEKYVNFVILYFVWYMNGLCPKGLNDPSVHWTLKHAVGSRGLCCDAGLYGKSWASSPHVGPQHFFLLKPLVPLKQKFRFLRGIETPVGISQQMSIITLELRFELTRLVRFSLCHCLPFSWLVRRSLMPVKPWSSGKVIFESWFLDRENLLLTELSN